MSDAALAWRRRRSAFVHDWLRNRFMPRLQACLTIAAPGIDVSAETARVFEAAVREWPARSAEALRLLDDFCAAMSPVTVVDAMPGISGVVADYLRRTALESWNVRHDIPQLVREARAAVDSANFSYSRWALPALADDCERLARALGQLPSKVML